jgi:predicted acyl esterase
MEWPQRVITVLAGSLVALVVLSNNERAGRAQTPPGDTVAVTRDVMIPMRDGVRLATDIYFPARDGIAVEEQRPVILERTPYRKSAMLYIFAGVDLMDSFLP